MTPSKRRTVLNISPPPEDLFDDSRMSCHEELLQDSEQSSSIWMDDSASNFSIVSSSSYNDNTEVPRKSRKRTPRQRPGPKPVSAEEASMDVFDADSAKGPHFVLSQLNQDSKSCPKGRWVTLVSLFYSEIFPTVYYCLLPSGHQILLLCSPTPLWGLLLSFSSLLHLFLDFSDI